MNYISKIFQKNTIGDYVGAVIIMLIFFGGIILFKFLNPAPYDPNQNIVKNNVSCEPNRLSYISLNEETDQNIDLIPNKKYMYAEAGNFVDSEIVIAKTETQNSKVACGYLYAKAGTQNGALRSWENLYINPNNFGGHINAKSAFSINDGADFSEYIFSLDNIEYRKSRNDQEILTADWSALFNVSPEVSFQIGLNTEDNTGFIEKISISYKCWDPKTGQENTGCKLEIK